MSLEEGRVSSIDHAIANLYIDRSQGIEQSIGEGYRQGHHDGYKAAWNKASNLSNSKLEYLRTRANEWFEVAERNSKEVHRFQVALAQVQAANQKLVDENNKLRNSLLQKENYIVEFNKAVRTLRQIIRQLQEENKRLQAKQ